MVSVTKETDFLQNKKYFQKLKKLTLIQSLPVLLGSLQNAVKTDDKRLVATRSYKANCDIKEYRKVCFENLYWKSKKLHSLPVWPLSLD